MGTSSGRGDLHLHTGIWDRDFWDFFKRSVAGKGRMGGPSLSVGGFYFQGGFIVDKV